MQPVYCELVLDSNDNVHFKENNVVTPFQKEWDRPWEKRELTFAIISGTEDLPKTSKEYAALGIALTTWGAEVDIKFKRVKTTDNPDIRIEFHTSSQNNRFKDHPTVLAYAYLSGQGSVSGRVIFNEDYQWSMDGKFVDGKKTYNLVHVMIHELGHTLGLLHDEAEETLDIMDPYYNPKILDLSEHDIYRIQKMYPKRQWKSQSRYQRLKNWLFKKKRKL